MKQQGKTVNNILNRFVSVFLASVMVLGVMSLGSLPGFAASEADPGITGIVVTKTYSAPQALDTMFIEIGGENLNNLGKNPVIVRDGSGNPAALTTIIENQFKLYYKIEKPKGISKLSVNGKDYDISAGKMPTISSISPANRIVSNTEQISIKGDGFKQFLFDIGSVKFYTESGSEDNHPPHEDIVDIIEGDVKIGEELKKGFLTYAPGGAYRVEFKYTEPANDTHAQLTIEDNYVDLFTVTGTLGVSDDISMMPNQGPVGTVVKIKGKELKGTNDMSVFFLKSLDGTDLYAKDNMGIDENYVPNAEKERDSDTVATIDVFTVRVPPKLEQGRYYVVLTNEIKQGEDPTGKIINTRVFVDNIFTVVNTSDTLSIID
ncbi:MAG TPA: hypothetical protein VFF25_02505, partial [Clostridia bacterium]|nr:hypothetical protein [Clostridia bacterium]